MKTCEAEGCEVKFISKTHNQKYGDPRCRKDLDACGEGRICRYRLESGDFPVEEDPITGDRPNDDFELRAAYNKLVTEYVKLKDKKDDLAGAVYEAVESELGNLNFPKITQPKKDRRTKGEEVAVAVLADWQLAKVTPDYNSEICEDRVEIFAQKVVDLTNIQREDHPVKKLHVWVLGDIVEGELIFPGQCFLVDGGLYRQVTVDGPRIMSTFLKTMLENFESVHVSCVIGNHGAIGGRSKRDHDPETNADRMLYRIVNLMFESEPRITFDIPDGGGERNWYTIDRIGEYSCLLCHGDQFRSFGSFHPFQKKVYGWKVGAIKEDFKDVFCGHWHTPTKMTFNTVQLRIAGSTESTNTYAIESLAAVGRPSQHLQFVHPQRGIVTAEYTCWLD
ncbi:hypothetical protein CL620_05030 [archaeon]|jgi:hypothetical protein|nr:hypothetical protein [archaeon]MDP6769563.1 hypothetical protein [Anaerolineales bacterium]